MTVPIPGNSSTEPADSRPFAAQHRNPADAGMLRSCAPPDPGARRQEVDSVNTTANRFMARNSVFAWIALAACALLLIPFGAMQVTTAISWDVADFVAMGLLLFAAGSAFVLVARKVPARYQWVVGALVVAAFLHAWAELAVGVFVNIGS